MSKTQERRCRDGNMWVRQIALRPHNALPFPYSSAFLENVYIVVCFFCTMVHYRSMSFLHKHVSIHSSLNYVLRMES